ncbi:MAG: DNA polymerase I [Desulfobacterales bacterium]|nr:DNA polymerase I [Desulfobacterales bacterium]
MVKENKEIYLIDGSAYIYRAYHAVKGLANSKGLPTNAVYGFTRMLIKLMDEKKPEYCAVFFDAKGETFRHKMFNEYKANRPKMPEDLAIQIPYIKDITQGFNLKVFELIGFEADDLIGTIAKIAESEGLNAVVVSGDKDFSQIITEKVTVWDPMKDKISNIDTIKNDYGLTPNQMIDVFALAGDTSDNIPGVTGIGIKTAVSLIQEFGSLDNIYTKLDKITKKKQAENLLQYKNNAFLSRDLVTIDTHAPISFDTDSKFDIKVFTIPPPNKKALSNIFKELEFTQLQKNFAPDSDLSLKNYTTILDLKAFNDLVLSLKKAGLFAVDTETTSEDPMIAKLVGISFSFAPNEAYYIPLKHSYLTVPQQLDFDYVLNELKPLLENEDIKKVGQNVKYDWIVFKRHGIELKGIIFDTMVASYVLNPSKRSHSLDSIAIEFLNHTSIKFSSVAGKGKNAVTFNKVPIEQASPYACEDADVTLLAYNILKKELEKIELLDLYEKVEMPLIPVLINMEMTGILIDKDKLISLSKYFQKEINTIEEQIYAQAGQRFNIQSPQQLGTILFEKLNLLSKKKTPKKTAYSTDVDVLTNLAETHELPRLILRHRTLSKLKSTYTDALLTIVNPNTGRIHTSFNQTVTATGRLSSSDPNLQNIPIRDVEGKEIRKAFIPYKECFLLSADYSQIELRILAHCSNDAILVDSFINNEDIHTRTASEVFQAIPALITPDLRRQAKEINFGIIYGMGAFKLSKQLGISQKMAKTYIENYFARYRGVKEFIEKTIDEAKNTGKSSTILGRIRYLPDIKSSNANIRQLAERMAVNTTIQGSAADLIKLAMIKIDNSLADKSLKSKMLLSVHDEILVEVPFNELDVVKSLVQEIMEGVWQLRVPLKVNIAWGKNWAEAH